MTGSPRGAVHHIELWVPDLGRAAPSWGWLLEELGYRPFQEWGDGRSWRLGATYVVLEQSPDLHPGPHERTRAGLNHLAFHGGTTGEVDALVAAAPARGWVLLFPDRHPHAGGPDTYAAYLADADGYEVEIVATTPG